MPINYIFRADIKQIGLMNRGQTGSGQQLMDNFSVGDVGIGEGGGTAVIGEGELVVIEAEGVQEGGVEVVDGDDVIDGTVTKIIGLTMDITRFETTAGKPQGKAMAIMVTTILAL